MGRPVFRGAPRESAGSSATARYLRRCKAMQVHQVTQVDDLKSDEVEAGVLKQAPRKEEAASHHRAYNDHYNASPSKDEAEPTKRT